MRHVRRRTFHGRRSGDNRKVNSVRLWQGPENSGPCCDIKKGIAVGMAIAQVTEETGVDIAEFDDKAVFTSAVEERRKELESTFSYDGYRVVRKELFAHMRDPAATIRPDSI